MVQLTLILLGRFHDVTVCVTGDVPRLPDGLQLLVKLILIERDGTEEKKKYKLKDWIL